MIENWLLLFLPLISWVFSFVITEVTQIVSKKLNMPIEKHCIVLCMIFIASLVANVFLEIAPKEFVLEMQEFMVATMWAAVVFHKIYKAYLEKNNDI